MKRVLNYNPKTQVVSTHARPWAGWDLARSRVLSQVSTKLAHIFVFVLRLQKQKQHSYQINRTLGLDRQ